MSERLCRICGRRGHAGSCVEDVRKETARRCSEIARELAGRAPGDLIPVGAGAQICDAIRKEFGLTGEPYATFLATSSGSPRCSGSGPTAAAPRPPQKSQGSAAAVYQKGGDA